MWLLLMSLLLAGGAPAARAVDILGLIDEILGDSPHAKNSYENSGYGYQEPYGQQQSAGYGQQPSYGYEPMMSYAPQQQSYAPQQQSYAPQQQSYAPQQQAYAPQQQSYAPQQQQQSYAPQQQSYAPQQQSYAPQQQQQSYVPQQQSYAPQQQSYDPPQRSYGQSKSRYQRKKKPKREKVYVPVVVKKKKKKMKIISVQKGFYIAGGTQLFGKYKSLKSCQKACAATPNCFAGDYNPWLNKCYIHSNFTACGILRSHKKLIHFKKIPCSFPEAPMGRVMLGIQIFKGLEQKGIKSLSDCLKKCASAGTGIPAQVANIADQICFGIDYDFGSHKCYFHVNNNNPPNHLCPAAGTEPPIPRDVVRNDHVISILLCPGP